MPSLPFLKEGTVTNQTGATLIAAMPVSVWPTRGTTSNVGRHYDHDGEAPLEFLSILRGSNVKLEVDGIDYAVVDATGHDMGIPHVALRLRESRASG